MTERISERLRVAQAEISERLVNGVMRFWLENGIDRAHGGYLTGFNEDGSPSGQTEKYVVTQTRMIWGFSKFYGAFPEDARLREAARRGLISF